MYKSKNSIFSIVVFVLLSCKTSTSLFATKTELSNNLVVGQGVRPTDHKTSFGIWLQTEIEGTYGPSFVMIFSSPYIIYKRNNFIVAFSNKKKIAIDLTNKTPWESYISSRSDSKIESFLGWEISELTPSDTLPISQYRKNYVQRYLDKSW